MTLSAIILTGGASSRMGADKASLDWHGRGAVDRLANLAREVGAELVMTVGTQPCGLPFVVEEPPGGGPVAGIAAAVDAVRARCDRILVLAVDAPTISAADLEPLLASAAPGAAYAGLHLPLVMDPAAFPDDAGAGWSVGRLIEGAGLARPACPPDAQRRLRGANTPEERARLLADLAATESAEEGGAA